MRKFFKKAKGLEGPAVNEKPTPRWFRRHRWWFFGVAILTLAAVFFIYQTRLKAEVKGQKIVAQPLALLQAESLKRLEFVLTGTVEPKDSRQIVLDSGKGVVQETLVAEGQSVTKGQELFRYVNQSGDFKIRDAELSVTNQEKVVTQAQENANLKWSQYNQQKVDLQTEQNTYNAASGEEQLNLKAALANQKALVEQALAEARGADLEVSNSQIMLEKTQLTLEAVRQENQGTTVTAEIDGVVKKIDSKQFNKVAASGEVFMEIQDTSTLYVAGTVDEFRKDQLALEQRVDVVDRSDLSPKWTGIVTQIGNTAAKEAESAEDSQDDNPNLTKYPFKVALDASDQSPVIGRHVFVNVVQTLPVEEAGTTPVLIPKEYVLQEKGGDFVWLVEKNKIQKTQISGAVYSADETLYQVKTGVPLEASIVLPQANLKAGQEVGTLVATD